VCDPSLAEDVVQEAFIDLWRSARSFEPGRGRGRSWILVITHRRAVDLVRREERRRAEPLRGFDAVGDEGADILVERKGERARLQNALQMLSVDQRRTLELAYYGGLTQSELAERFGEPLGTIKSRMFHGLQRLRGILAESPA